MNWKKLGKYSLRIVIVVVAYWFLLKKLTSFANWNLLSERVAEGWLNLLLQLLPIVMLAFINWFLRSVIWQYLGGAIQHLHIRTAIKAVFIGTTSGSFTPAKIGDLLGRASVFKAEVRKKGVFLAAFGTFIQNLGMALPGLIAFYYFLIKYPFKNQLLIHLSGWVLIATFFVLLLFVLVLPFAVTALIKVVKHKRFLGVLNVMKQLGHVTYFKIIGLNLVKNVLLYLELFLFLRFWGIAISPEQALILIPAYFFTLGFLPGFIFADLGVVGSYSVLIFGTAFSNYPAIVITAMGLWLLNIGIPILIGGYFIIRGKRMNKVKQ